MKLGQLIHLEKRALENWLVKLDVATLLSVEKPHLSIQRYRREAIKVDSFSVAASQIWELDGICFNLFITSLRFKN